jgi:PAS domain S-box-containing protein
MDGDGRVVELNPAAERTFGCRRADALGRTVAELVVPPRMRSAHEEGVRRLLAGAQSRMIGRRVELTAARVDGAEFPVELTLTRTSEEPPRFTAWIRDLTERRELEGQSERRQRVLERAEELAGMGSWSWRLRDDEVVWTDNLFRLLGLEPGAATPSAELFAEHLHPEDREVVRKLGAARYRTELTPMEMRVVRADGSVRHLRTTAWVEDLGKAEHALMGSVHDITEQHMAQREIAARVAFSEALSKWSSVDDGGERLIRELAGALGFEAGTIWLPELGALVARVTWSAPGGTPPAEVGERSTARSGAAGLAWALHEPAVGRRPHRAAREALAIPALLGDEVLAVVELEDGNTETASQLIRMLAGLSYELGAFLARRRGELKPAQLTPRELEVLQLAAHGLSGPQIARRLVVSPATVKSHFEHIYARLGVSDRSAAVAHALREGLIE